jgi:NCAIR mutase (PurE)-related protein
MLDGKSLTELLEAVSKGASSPEEAFKAIASGGLTRDLGYAKLDMSRGERCGFPEFVFGEGKTPEQVCGIMKALKASGRPVLTTRITPSIAEAVAAQLPEAEIDLLARTASIKQGVEALGGGYVLVATAGTSDLPVALEAKRTAELCGCETRLLSDAGVAGIHRLLAEKGQLEGAAAIIAVAGMEGALPSVIAGLASCPVIAVPTPVGYGASFGGLAALLAMLNSCASGVTVVNIGNGFGAGCAAARILRAKRKA